MSGDKPDSPERAAMVGFPEAHCRVVSCRVSGDDAYVLLDTGSPGQPYLYGSNCHRADGQWFETSSSNGPGWGQTGNDPDLGTLSFWGNAPARADMLRVDFAGTVVEEPIHGGVYLLVWWRVPSTTEWPKIVAIREDGAWRPESDMGLALRAVADRGHVRGGAA